MGFDSRVKEPVGQIDEEIEKNQHRTIDDHHPAKEESVAIQDGMHKKTAGARDVENGFDDDGSREQVRSQAAELRRLRAELREFDGAFFESLEALKWEYAQAAALASSDYQGNIAAPGVSTLTRSAMELIAPHTTRALQVTPPF